VTLRSLCFLLAAVLYAVGLAGVISLGAFLAVNIALMLIAFGTGFLVVGILRSTAPRARSPG